MTHSFQALGTTWWIEIFDEVDQETLTVAFGDCERFVTEFELQYSRFKTDSYVSLLNTRRFLDNPDERLQTLLTYGKNAYLRTNTRFNILTGHILETRGYDADYSFLPQDETALQVGNPVSDLIITPQKIELRHGHIDLGGFGKGYAVDEVASRLRETHNLQFFIINAGGDIYTTSNHGRPVDIYLEHPTHAKTFIQKTPLLNQGFASSSQFKRRWTGTDGKPYSHIVQSYTPAPAASFIKAPSACEADVFATVALTTPTAELHQLLRAEQIAGAFFHTETNQLTGSPAFFSN